MDSDTDSDPEITPVPIAEEICETSLNKLPETSKKKYETAYNLFMDWRRDENKTSFSEHVLMTYFVELSKKYKSATLWVKYSMLRTTLISYQNVDIAKYGKLKAFLRRKSTGYIPKKSKTFSTEEICKFISEAPDEQYLLIKAALIMGVMGGCRRHELNQMKITHLSDLGSAVLVTVPDINAKTARTFTVTSNFYDVIKKYWNLRPANANDLSFFLNYEKGECTEQKIGINKIGAMGKQIATYLQLPNPELYTGRCFRTSSTTLLVDVIEDKTYFRGHNDVKVELEETHIYEPSIENETNVPIKTEDCSPHNEENIFEEITSKMIFNNCNITFNICSDAFNKNY